tara:strand:- start:2028 stop:2225 length:198 start_codon:yes stop_codon:yes gene_type:complete
MNKPITYMPDTNGALKAIADLNYEMRNPYNDGFTQSGMKEKLVAIKKEVDRALMNAPTFTGESRR